MFKKSLIAGAFMALASTGSWAASPVSCAGGVENCANASDDAIPLQASPWFVDTASWEGLGGVVTIDLGGTQLVGHVFLALDNNDSYALESSLDGNSWSPLGSVAASAGTVTSGIDWFTSIADTPFSVGTLAFAPVQAAYLRVRATGGDGLYSVGEVGWTAAPAVPEPATWALMLAGAAGLVARRRAAR